MDNNFVAIVDYDLGNLFSVEQACKKAGLSAVITSSADVIQESSAVILTGVGAFAKAMKILTSKGLMDVLRDYSLSGKPLIGICLGMQILMTQSDEFGVHQGLDIIKGKVKRLKVDSQAQEIFKVPHVGWSEIDSFSVCPQKDSLLEGIESGSQMYFVHSYFVEPQNQEVILCKTTYGANEFCSGLRFNNISAFQFHPECSGPKGLKIYENLAKQITRSNKEDLCVDKK